VSAPTRRDPGADLGDAIDDRHQIGRHRLGPARVGELDLDTGEAGKDGELAPFHMARFAAQGLRQG
jgi:hypothetical protein